jgi:patatin-like phospholipase/acyl hydrolase
MPVKPFRILALDGGGIMGAFTASVLATFEAATGRRVCEHFDLITGTSTGGLIALALGMGNEAARVCRMYSEHGQLIFPRDRFWWDGLLRHLSGPKFATEPLRTAIGELLHDATLDAAKVCLAIPVYDANKGQVIVFKTAHGGRYHWYKETPAIEVALATSAAPTDFEAHTIESNSGSFTYIDGGVWANCPAMVGVTEAIDIFHRSPSDIHLLSISTTSYPFRIKDAKRTGGIIRWNKTLIETLMFGQVQAAVAQATCILRHGLFHRVDYDAPPNVYSLDNSGSVKQLVADGQDAAQQRANLDVVARHFLNGDNALPFSAYLRATPDRLSRPGREAAEKL